MRGNAVKTMLTLAAISTVASLQVFGKDRLIFWRESAAGGSPACVPQLPALRPAACQTALGLLTVLARLLLPKEVQCHMPAGLVASLGDGGGLFWACEQGEAKAVMRKRPHIDKSLIQLVT